MQVKTIVNCSKGWIVGDFPLAIFQDKNCEVAIKRYNKGEYESKHFHSFTTEVTVIVEGSVRMNSKILTKNEAIIIEPFEATDFECLTDVVTVVFKNKSSINDKTLGEYMNNLNDIENFLDPHTFFSFLEEKEHSIIVYVSHMNEEVLRITNAIPDKVNGKHVLVHFESALDDKWAHNNEIIIAAPGKIEELDFLMDDFKPEEVPVFGLTETLAELIESEQNDTYDYTCYVSSKE